tara:strand:+ start:6122 stop:6625 length:504 start_codon:yes stop_codon:yes gene_type:complete
MKQTNWRELVEVLGVVSIVAALFLIALELREANRIEYHIAEAQTQIAISERLASMLAAQARDPELAKLYAKMSAERGHLITATDESQMQALARQYLNIYRTVQICYDNGLLPAQQLATHASDLAALLQAYPGLKEALQTGLDELGDAGRSAVFKPLGDALSGAADPA